MILAACGKSGAPAAAAPPEVGVIAAQPQDVPLIRDFVGRLSAYRSADVRARVAGVLLKRVYEEGSEVKQGQVLFEIDPAPLKATLDAARGSLAQARATFANNRVAAERARDLAPKGFISKADLDSAEAAERTSAAAVKQAEAVVESARINLGYADVTAPISGRAGQQQVTEGALVGQGSATLLTTIEQLDPVYVNFTMSVTDLHALQRVLGSNGATLGTGAAAKVKLALPDGSTYGETGTIDFSDAQVDPATGAVTLRAVVPNPAHMLLPGMYVSLSADFGHRHGVYRIPQMALQRTDTGPFVLVVGQDGNVTSRNVNVASASGSDWIIDSGLSAADQVIVSGIQRAIPGKPAKAVPWQAPAPASGTATATPPH